MELTREQLERIKDQAQKRGRMIATPNDFCEKHYWELLPCRKCKEAKE